MPSAKSLRAGRRLRKPLERIAGEGGVSGASGGLDELAKHPHRHPRLEGFESRAGPTPRPPRSGRGRCAAPRRPSARTAMPVLRPQLARLCLIAAEASASLPCSARSLSGATAGPAPGRRRDAVGLGDWRRRAREVADPRAPCRARRGGAAAQRVRRHRARAGPGARRSRAPSLSQTALLAAVAIQPQRRTSSTGMSQERLRGSLQHRSRTACPSLVSRASPSSSRSRGRGAPGAVEGPGPRGRSRG